MLMMLICTDAIEHHAIPDFLGQGELPVELQLDGVVGAHLTNESEEDTGRLIKHTHKGGSDFLHQSELNTNLLLFTLQHC